MDSTLNPSRSDTPPKASQKMADEKMEKILFWENVSIIFKTTGMITWFIICVLALLEIKRYFNIDFIPGYDSALDDMYGAVRGTISERIGDR